MQKQALGRDNVKNMMVGGAAIGSGLAVLGALVDYIRSNKRQADAAEGGHEEETMDLVIPYSQDKMAAIVPAVAALLTAGGSYWMVRELLNSTWRRPQLKREVAEAQTGYIDTLRDPQQAAEKKASGISLMDVIKGSPHAMFLLPALAGGVGTYGILENTFPSVKEKQAPGKIKKIRIKGYGTVVADGPGDGPLAARDKVLQAEAEAKAKKELADDAAADSELEEEAAKAVSGGYFSFPKLDLSTLFSKAAAAAIRVSAADDIRASKLLCLILTAGHDKPASLLSGLLGLVAHSGLEVVEKLAAADGFLELADDVDAYNAVWDELPCLTKRATVDAAMDSPVLRPSVALLLAAELNDAHPGIAKLAATIKALEPDRTACLVKFGSIFYGVEELALKFEPGIRKEATDDSADRDVATASDGSSVDASADGEMVDPIDKMLNGDTVITAGVKDLKGQNPNQNS